ncbi:MAG: MarR family transcriptional regulator [Anaerolineales bacterium]|nr:MarR family transcriptional regulator [Anaerolineales bacterium]
MSKHLQFSKAMRAWMDMFMHRSMHGMTKFVKSTGLSMPQFSILMQLRHKETCGISDISERFDISNAAASQLAEKLVQSGHIERAEDPNDRRAKILRLTQQGRDLIDAGFNERVSWLNDLEATLSAEKKLKVVAALNILAEAAKSLEEKE